jgi:hypothetical protein
MAHPVKPTTGEAEAIIDRLRAICLELPGALEKLAWGEPTFRAGKGKMFAQVDNDHHESGHVAVWMPLGFEAQDALVGSDSDRYFVPPYQGVRGWVGMRLSDDAVDWDEVVEVIEDAFRLVAGKRLLAELDARG